MNRRGQKSLEDHSPWGCKESDTTKRLALSLIFWDRPNFYPITRQRVRHHVLSFYLENDLMEQWPSSYGQNQTPRARTGRWYGEHYHSLLKLTLYPDDVNEIFSLTLHRSWQIRTVFNIPSYLFNPTISTQRPECQELCELLGLQRDRTGLQWGILLFKAGFLTWNGSLSTPWIWT